MWKSNSRSCWTNSSIKGWVQKRRDLGGLIFIDLRDRTGIVQVVFNPETSKEALEVAETIRSEYVLHVEGTVVERGEGAINDNMATGRIEVQATKVNVLNARKQRQSSLLMIQMHQKMCV